MLADLLTNLDELIMSLINISNKKLPQLREEVECFAIRNAV